MGITMKRNVLITGGSRGIGAAAVRKFAASGDYVTFMYRDNKAAAQAVASETAATAVQCDITDSGIVRTVMAGLPAFDVLVCCAGVSHIGLFQDMTDAEWETVRGANLDGAVNVLRSVIPGMIEKKSGSIVLVTSMWGEVGASCEAAYAATKGALAALGKSLAKELGPSGIRVNMVSPGVIDTDMNAGLTPETLAELTEETPLGRIGRPGEVADAIFYLASEEASFITGCELAVNGGFVI